MTHLGQSCLKPSGIDRHPALSQARQLPALELAPIGGTTTPLACWIHLAR